MPGCNVRSLSKSVDEGMSSFFESLARAVTARPYLTILLSVLFAVAMLPGMLSAEKELNGEKLWTPQDTESKAQDTWVKANFGSGDRQARIYSENGGANLLSRENLLGLEKLHEALLATTADCEKGTCEGKKVSYADVRARQHSSVLSIWSDKAPPVGTDILADVNNKSKWRGTDGAKLKLGDMLGGVQYDSNGTIISAGAFMTKLWLLNIKERVESSDKAPATDAWEMSLDDSVIAFTHSSLPTSHPWTSTGQGQAAGGAIKGDVGLLSQGYLLLIIFSIIVLSHHKLIHSNGVMAMASITAVGLSIVSAFGMCSYLGVKQNLVTSVLFLVLLGIGVDDTYVIMGEFSHVHGDPRERVIKTLSKAGTSIAVTSMTDIVAFAVGVTSSLPALQDFCIFASVGIMFDFMFQSTFLIAILYLRAKGSADNRPDWLCCMRVDPERTGFCGCSAPVCSRNGKHVCCPCSKPVENSDDTLGLTRRALNHITNFTMKPIGIAVVVVATVGLLAGACSGLPNLKTDFDIKWFTPDGHYYKDTYAAQDKYFPTSGGIAVYVYTKPGNYAAAHSDGSLAAMYKRTVDCSWVNRGVGDWYSAFATDAGRSNRSKASDPVFANEVRMFVNSTEGKRFAKDVLISSDGNGAYSIQGSRSLFIMEESKSGEDNIASMKVLRTCVGGEPLDAFGFDFRFLYHDGLELTEKECIQNVILACISVFVVCVIMLADLAAAFIVLLMIGLVDFCIIGYMSHWGLDFNSVTAVNLVLAVGLAVDYAAHVAHKFLVVGGTGEQRARAAVDKIGPSVFNGAFSTFLAILPLAFSKSYVFQVFFKMWFMIIVFGVYFGMIVLPLVLRLAGRIVGSASESDEAGTSRQSRADLATIGQTKVTPYTEGA